MIKFPHTFNSAYMFTLTCYQQVSYLIQCKNNYERCYVVQLGLSQINVSWVSSSPGFSISNQDSSQYKNLIFFISQLEKNVKEDETENLKSKEVKEIWENRGTF